MRESIQIAAVECYCIILKNQTKIIQSVLYENLSLKQESIEINKWLNQWK